MESVSMQWGMNMVTPILQTFSKGYSSVKMFESSIKFIGIYSLEYVPCLIDNKSALH